jgi:hypothetical protein
LLNDSHVRHRQRCIPRSRCSSGNSPQQLQPSAIHIPVIYTKPRILIGLPGIHRNPVIPTGIQWNPVESSGFQWVPMDSSGFRWIPPDSTGIQWIPMFLVIIIHSN